MFTLATLDAITLGVYGYHNDKSYRECTEKFSDLAETGDDPEYKQVYKQLRKHMWDVVKIDNRWYNVDMTSGPVYEPMFCVDDDDYRRIMGYVSAFECTSKAPKEEIFVYPVKHLKRIRERTD